MPPAREHEVARLVTVQFFVRSTSDEMRLARLPPTSLSPSTTATVLYWYFHWNVHVPQGATGRTGTAPSVHTHTPQCSTLRTTTGDQERGRQRVVALTLCSRSVPTGWWGGSRSSKPQACRTAGGWERLRVGPQHRLVRIQRRQLLGPWSACCFDCVHQSLSQSGSLAQAERGPSPVKTFS